MGWRFRIQSYKSTGTWSTDYTSKYQTAQATYLESASAGNGFSRRAWTGPFTLDHGDQRVIVEMQWWKAGSVQGYVKLRYTQYRAQTDSGDHEWIIDRCFATYEQG